MHPGQRRAPRAWQPLGLQMAQWPPLLRRSTVSHRCSHGCRMANLRLICYTLSIAEEDGRPAQSRASTSCHCMHGPSSVTRHRVHSRLVQIFIISHGAMKMLQEERCFRACMQEECLSISRQRHQNPRVQTEAKHLQHQSGPQQPGSSTSSATLPQLHGVQ